MDLATVLFTVLGGFGAFGLMTFNYLLKKYEKLSKKVDLLEAENYSLSQFLNNFLFKFSMTANKSSVTIDEQITLLIDTSQQELAEIIRRYDNEKLAIEKKD